MNMLDAIGNPELSSSKGQHDVESSLQQRQQQLLLMGESLQQAHGLMNAPSTTTSTNNAWMAAASYSNGHLSGLEASTFATGGPQNSLSYLQKWQVPARSAVHDANATSLGNSNIGSGGFLSQNHMPMMTMSMNALVDNNNGAPFLSSNNSNDNTDAQVRQASLQLQVENSRLEVYLSQQKRQLMLLRQQLQNVGQSHQQQMNHRHLPLPPQQSSSSMMRMMMMMDQQQHQPLNTSIDVNSLLNATVLDLPNHQQQQQLDQEQQHRRNSIFGFLEQHQDRRNSMAGLSELFNEIGRAHV